MPTLPAGIYEAGDYIIASISVDSTATALRISIDVTSMTDPLNSVLIIGEVSLDGGITWLELFKVPFRGGPLKLPGPTIRLSNAEWPIPGIGNENRMVRGTITVVGPSISTSADLEVK